MFFRFIFVFLGSVVGEERDTKKNRAVDSPRTHSILGGGLIDSSKRKHANPAPSSQTLLLQIEDVDVTIIGENAFLTEGNGKYAPCYENDEKGQGRDRRENGVGPREGGPLAARDDLLPAGFQERRRLRCKEHLRGAGLPSGHRSHQEPCV